MITKEEYFTALETLEALYFLTLSLEDRAEAAISQMRDAFESGKAQVLNAILNDIASLREHYGAIAPRGKKVPGVFSDSQETLLLKEKRFFLQ